MPDPSVNEGHYDLLLTNVSVAYVQDESSFVADKVFNVVPVNEASSFYWQYPRGYFFRDDVGPRPMGGYSRVTGYKLTKGYYSCEEQALSAMLDDRERANATPPHDPERSKTKLLTSQHMIHRDKVWAAAYFKAGIWTTDLTGTTSTTPGPTQFIQWDQSTSDPISEIKKRKRAVRQITGYEPNVLVIGSDVEIALENHPDILDRIKYTQRGVVDTDLLCSLFKVQQVLVPLGVENNGEEGLADNFSFIVDTKSALLAYTPSEPGLEVPAAGYTFSWTGLLGNNAFAQPLAVWRGRDERAHSDWFEVRVAYSMGVVSPDLGVFFGNAVA